ncbi:MAG: hypothetical protein RBS35_05455 [Azonexus sp.]|jgi:hypothetical protein|nr:hypothetical protein [Azonexus sp.]
MLPFVIALIVMLIGVWVIYLLLKNMGESGIEAAAPGSCRSGQCGVRCATHQRADGHEPAIEGPDLPGDTRR